MYDSMNSLYNLSFRTEFLDDLSSMYHIHGLSVLHNVVSSSGARGSCCKWSQNLRSRCEILVVEHWGIRNYPNSLRVSGPYLIKIYTSRNLWRRTLHLCCWLHSEFDLYHCIRVLHYPNWFRASEKSTNMIVLWVWNPWVDEMNTLLPLHPDIFPTPWQYSYPYIQYPEPPDSSLCK